uniref:Uncharacterized protein n=1 Tax=Branchiostoma floridae TaxID=7739 RepID=C3ZQ83_BRAFL|eukprot:XP_002589451.1 hypothetical protein BRAFLDRAFT_80154 [Branchiostoma floridae]
MKQEAQETVCSAQQLAARRRQEARCGCTDGSKDRKLCCCRPAEGKKSDVAAPMGVSTGNCDVSCWWPAEVKKSDVAAPMGVRTGSCAVVGQQKARRAMWLHRWE